MSKDNYIIDDLDQFAESARKLVYNGFGKGVTDDPDEFTKLVTDISPEEVEELNKILSQQEALIIVKNIAKEQKHKISNKIRYIINEKIFSQIIEEMNSRLVSNILTNLASRGLIESAYDTTLNDFVFWVNEDETKNPKPETD
jgi:Mg/Co/Ni transporter MgtE